MVVIKGDTKNLDYGSHGAPGYGVLEHDYCYGYNHGYRYLYTPYGNPFLYATVALMKGGGNTISLPSQNNLGQSNLFSDQFGARKGLNKVHQQ